MENKLFVYGTLIDDEIQKNVIGRIIKGIPDTLKGYRKSAIEINGENYPLIIPDEAGKIEGIMIDVSDSELEKIDRYETDAYKRIMVSLESGIVSLVYVKR